MITSTLDNQWSAEVYRGIIPAELWGEPYMSTDELRKEITSDVRFFCSEVQEAWQ